MYQIGKLNNMKVVILAGGYGTRISEESYLKPKPMIEIGEMPILIHIMNIYAAQGFKDFVICAGYKQKVIKDYFLNYFLYKNDVVFHIGKNNQWNEFLTSNTDDWNVIVADTGLNTQTGGRLKRIQKYIGNERFMLTYGDAVGDINLHDLLLKHEKSKNDVTMSVYNFGQSKGVVELDEDCNIKNFREKSDLDGNLINIGFMVMEPSIFEEIEGDDSVLEMGPLKTLAKKGKLGAYIHTGYWQCMDTLSEKKKLEQLWQTGNAPWKIWKN